MPLLRINLRDVLLAHHRRVERTHLSGRRARALRARELEKLRISSDDLAPSGGRAETDTEAAFRILGISDRIDRDAAEDRLPPERIVHFEAVRRTCVNYGLILRPFRDYKGLLAKEVASEVLKLRSMLGHEPAANRFYIAAPREMFCDSLTASDPFLFYEIGPDEYYLVHQWGVDASPLRLITHWPRGTRRRLFAIRSAACVLLAGVLADALGRFNVPAEAGWIGAMLLTGAWLRSFWEFRYRRSSLDRRWYHA